MSKIYLKRFFFYICIEVFLISFLILYVIIEILYYRDWKVFFKVVKEESLKFGGNIWKYWRENLKVENNIKSFLILLRKS